MKSALAIGAGVAGASAIAPKTATAGPLNVLDPERMGVLVDTTVCIGCRRCEWACKTAHDLPADNISTYDDREVFKHPRRPDTKALTVVNEYPGMKEGVEQFDVKVQCMHCDHPACVSACIVGAFSKQPNGAVIWDGDKCIGCRYCMVACPFQVPTFEFDKAIQPKIMKCDFCFPRTSQDKLPACVEICPMEAITFGKRSEVVRVAHARIAQTPDRYHPHVYGATEVGGTGWVYLGGGDLTGVAFPKLSEKPAPGVSESIQHGIFAYFVPPIALYSLLGLVMWISKNREKHQEEEV